MNIIRIKTIKSNIMMYIIQYNTQISTIINGNAIIKKFKKLINSGNYWMMKHDNKNQARKLVYALIEL